MHCSTLPSYVIRVLPLLITPSEALLWITLLVTRASGILILCPDYFTVVLFTYSLSPQLSSNNHSEIPICVSIIHVFHSYSSICSCQTPFLSLDFFFPLFQVQTSLPHANPGRITLHLKFIFTSLFIFLLLHILPQLSLQIYPVFSLIRPSVDPLLHDTFSSYLNSLAFSHASIFSVIL